MTQPSRDGRAMLALLVVGGIWGASFLFIKVAIDEVSTIEVVAARLTLGAITVAVLMRTLRMPLRYDAPLLRHIVVTAVVTNILPFALIAGAEEHIESGIASVLNGTMPIFTAVFAAILLAEERFTAARGVGLLLGFLGVITLTGDDILQITDSSVLGQLAVIGAAACYAAGAVYMRRLLDGRDPASLSMLQLIAGTAIIIPALFVVEGTPDYAISIEATLSLLALGVFGTGFAYIAYLWLLEAIGSVRASLVTYIIPVVGLFLGWAVLDESVGANTLAGAALIIGGVAIVLRGQGVGRNSPVEERVGVVKISRKTT